MVGEEAYNFRRLGAECDVYVMKRRPSEIEPAHTEHFRLIHLDERLGVLARVCGWRIPTFSFFSLYHLAYPLILTKSASKKLQQYDVVISHSASTAIFASTLKISEAKLLLFYYDPISYMMRSAYQESWSDFRRAILSQAGNLVDKKLLSKAGVVVLLSRFHYNRITSLGLGKPVTVVYPGADSAATLPTERDDYVLSVARWETGKNPFFLIDLASEMRGKSPKFVMVGAWKSSDLLSKFQREAKRRGVAEKFCLVPNIYGDRLREFYLRARCLVHAKKEAFGLTGLEAAAHGCPVIFPKGSGVTELFSDGLHGYFPEEGNIDQYVSALSRLVMDPLLAHNMGYEAWKVARKHTWSEHARALFQIALNISEP